MNNLRVHTPHRNGSGLYVLHIDNDTKIYHTYYTAACIVDFLGFDIIEINVQTKKEIKNIIKQLNKLGYIELTHIKYLELIKGVK